MLMAKFDFSDKRLSIVDARGHRVELTSQEAIELLQLLSDKKTNLLRFSSHDIHQEIAIHLRQPQFAYLDTLKAAIPQLQESLSATNVFVAPADAVTERAIQLLEEFRIEYKLHPLLEDDNAFAQG